MSTAEIGARGTSRAQNRAFYDAIWSASDLVRPERFNTWLRLSVLTAEAPRRLEVGPGLHPRLPIAGTHFVDVSTPALRRLRALGGVSLLADAGTLPFADAWFEVVCAFDVVEHLADDRSVLGELARVASDDAHVILSVPLHPARWTAFDALVGHVRRYEPGALLSLLDAYDLVVEESAAFGMAPRSRWLLDLAAWSLTRSHTRAMRWYNHVFRPVGLLLQKPVEWTLGLLDLAAVDEVLLVCRRRARARAARGTDVAAPVSRATAGAARSRRSGRSS